MIDLNKVKEGDAVKFRCGGEAVVREINKPGSNSYVVRFNDYEDYASSLFQPNGVKHNRSIFTTPFDIIEIIPAPFDWADVKAGMAFENEAGEIYYFRCLDFESDTFVIASTHNIKASSVSFCCKSGITRSPEHDIEVKS